MEVPESIIGSFFSGLDSYLKNNLHAITGKDIRRIYTAFSNKLKQYRGNANGFTGLSEFLIFRMLYHLLRERLDFSFEPERLTPDLFVFSTKDRHFFLGQSTPVSMGNKKVYPDVSLSKGKEMFRIISIKLYLTTGLGEIEKEYEVFRLLKDHFPNLKCLLLIFGLVPKSGKIRRRMEDLKQDRAGFDYRILDENEASLAHEMTSWLDVDALIGSD